MADDFHVVATTADRVGARLIGGAIVVARRAGRDFAVGSAATVMIRPERVQIEDEPLPDRIGLWATVSHRIFHGASSDVLVCTEDGTELVADLEADDSFQVKVGDRVWITWANTSSYVLPEATDRAGATGTDVERVEASL